MREAFLIQPRIQFSSQANMTEWSKVLRSGRSVFARVGSNPTVCIFTSFFSPLFVVLFYYLFFATHAYCQSALHQNNEEMKRRSLIPVFTEHKEQHCNILPNMSTSCWNNHFNRCLQMISEKHLQCNAISLQKCIPHMRKRVFMMPTIQGVITSTTGDSDTHGDLHSHCQEPSTSI